MKILFIGDISGKPGREMVAENLSTLRKKHKIDFVIANAENSAHGKGVTIEILNELTSYGIDFFTSGDHVWEQKKFLKELTNPNLPLIRPYNYEGNEQISGSGYRYLDLGKKQIIVMNFIGQTFMREHVRSPFWSFDELWQRLIDERLIVENSKDNPIVIMDFHAEATSEKIAFAWYVRDKVKMFCGTHTHVATADQRIIGDMAFVSDVGMCGPYDASLWASFDSVINNFKYPTKLKNEMEELGSRIFNSVLVEFENNLAKSIIRLDFVKKFTEK